MKLSISAKNMDVVKKKLSQAAERCKNQYGFWDVVAGKAYKQVIDNFRQEQGPDGKWEPLQKRRTRDTKMARKKMAKAKPIRGGKILQDTGRLISSIRYRVGKSFVELFTNLKYAAAHQYGDSPRNLPQREFLWVPKDFLKNVAESLAKYVAKGD
jgi:phage gpG-like protein